MKQALVSLCFAGGIVFYFTVHVFNVFMFVCICVCVSVCAHVVAVIEMTGCHDSLCITKAC